jgi:hypothetical protein
MKRCSFEEVPRNIKDSALSGDVDDLTSNASCTMIGKIIPIGTGGPFRLFEDIKKNQECMKQQQLRKRNREIEDDDDDDDLCRLIPMLKKPCNPYHMMLSPDFCEDRKSIDYRRLKVEVNSQMRDTDYSDFIDPQTISRFNFLRLRNVPLLDNQQQQHLQLPIPNSAKIRETQDNRDNRDNRRKISIEILPFGRYTSPPKWQHPRASIYRKCRDFLRKTGLIPGKVKSKSKSKSKLKLKSKSKSKSKPKTHSKMSKDKNVVAMI